MVQKIRKNPDSGKKPGFLCLFPTFLNRFIYKVWFSFVLRSPRVTWWKKSGKIRIPPDSIFFRIFSKMDSLCYFVIIKCFYFFKISISTMATVGLEISGWDWLALAFQTDLWISQTDNERNAREARMSASRYNNPFELWEPFSFQTLQNS